MDIVMDHLSKRFGEKEVIKDFSIRMKEGCVTSIMAPSGWGKTTLLRILAGLERADEGRIEMDCIIESENPDWKIKK